MCFLNLYHVSWKSKEILKNTGFQGPDYEDNLSLYDIRTRNANYVSSEQIKIFEEMTQIAMMKNGKLDPDSYEIQEFLLLKKYQRTNGISKLSDIYSIGAIMFKLLLGRAPTQHISTATGAVKGWSGGDNNELQEVYKACASKSAQALSQWVFGKKDAERSTK